MFPSLAKSIYNVQREWEKEKERDNDDDDDDDVIPYHQLKEKKISNKLVLVFIYILRNLKNRARKNEGTDKKTEQCSVKVASFPKM